MVETIAGETPGFSHSDLQSLISLMTKSAIKRQYSSFSQLLESSVPDLDIHKALHVDFTDYLQAKRLIHPSGLR